MLDYYVVLGLNRGASSNDVDSAYRSNALKYHPERNSSPQAQELFSKVSEAYDVLSNVYDKFGANGLRDGVPSVEGLEHGYSFHGRIEEIFRDFFGSENPFSELMLNPKIERPYGAKFGGLQGLNSATAGQSYPARPAAAPQVPQETPLEVEVPCTLEELYNGSARRLTVSRRRLNDDGITTRAEEKTFAIEIKRGYKNNTRLVFPGEGNQGNNRQGGDLVFIIKEQRHGTFVRDGSNLRFEAAIPLITALTGSIVELAMLDGRQLKVPINDIIHPTYTKTVPDEGMPDAKDPSKRGNLILSFKLEFPLYISAEQKLALNHAFGN